MANPEVAATRTTIRILDAQHQIASTLSKFADDMSYVDDMDAEERSEVYAILRALEDDVKISREQLASLTSALECEGVHCA